MPSKTLYHFGISGGKDSTALLLWACYESNIPLDQIRATFCDTGNESPITLAYVKMLSDFVFSIETIYPPLGFYDLALKKKRFPSAKARFCTQELKMKPTQAWVRLRWDEGHTVILHSGVRAAESFERSKMPEEEFENYYACTVRRPLLKYTLADVWAIHDRYSVPRNPLYAMGMSRVGCFPCVMSNKREMRNMAEKFPDRIQWLSEKEWGWPTNHSNPDGFRSFFSRTHVPERQRSGPMVPRKEQKDFVQATTVEDVARWSKTVRGGKQYALGTIEEDAFEREDDKTISCPSAIGQCE